MDYGIKTTYSSSVLDILVNLSVSVLSCKMGLYQQAHKSWRYDEMKLMFINTSQLSDE